MAEEVSQEYARIGQDIQGDLYAMLGPSWTHKPDITTKVTITKKRWQIQTKIDRRTKSGRIFWAVSAGTGIWGPKHRPYTIRPRRAKALRFKVPFRPQTLPATAFTQRARALERKGPEETVYTQKVTATGIRPRNFHTRLRVRYNNRKWNGGFYQRSENAARRGMRKGRRKYVTVPA
jgi:hypothetical protein